MPGSPKWSLSMIYNIYYEFRKYLTRWSRLDITVALVKFLLYLWEFSLHFSARNPTTLTSILLRPSDFPKYNSVMVLQTGPQALHCTTCSLYYPKSSYHSVLYFETLTGFLFIACRGIQVLNFTIVLSFLASEVAQLLQELYYRLWERRTGVTFPAAV